MGDVIYPGLHLYGIHDTTEEHVREAIFDIIGPEPELYVDQGPHVTILRQEGQALVNIVISGIVLPFNEIRRCLAMRRIGNSIIKIYGVDFGAPRQSNGQHIFRFEKLHEKLARGQGIGIEPMKIVNKNLMESQLGGWIRPSKVIRFMANLRTCQNRNMEREREMLREPGQMLYYWNFQHDSSSIQLHYVYVIEALQAVLRLNRNPQFFRPPTSFFMKHHCRYSGMDFLGTDSLPLEAAHLMATRKYIPSTSVQSRVIDPAEFRRYATDCNVCKNIFVLIGYSADLTWFAARCECIEKGSLITWENETFVRLIVNPEVERIWERQGDDVQLVDKPILFQFLKGQTPLFASVDELMRSGHAAAIHEFRKTKDDLAKYSSQLGTVVNVKVLDEIGERINLKITIRTKRTATWCEEKQSSVDRAMLIPPGKGFYFIESKPVKKHEDEASRDLDEMQRNEGVHEEDIREIHYGPPNKQHSAKVYSMEDEITGHVTVTAIVNINAKDSISEGTIYFMVPKPPTAQLLALRKVLSEWFREESNRQRQMHSGLVTAADYRGDVTFVSHLTLTPVWIITILVRETRDMALNQDYSLDMYCGCDLFVRVRNVEREMEEKIIKRTGRVLTVDIRANIIIMEVALLLEPIWSIVEDGADNPDNIHFRLWAIKEKPRDEEANDNFIVDAVEQIAGDDDDWQEENNENGQINNDEDVQVGHDEDLINVFVRPALPAPPTVSVYERIRPPVLQYENIHDLALSWEERPVEIDCSFLDYLLKRNEDYILHPIDIGIEFSDTTNDQIVDRIRGRLNDSQRDVIKNMLTRPLSVAIGPPGTGKSTCATFGILWLYLVHGGTIIVCAPSNFAAQVLYDKLIAYKREMGVDVDILRMLSRSRERAHMRRNPVPEDNDRNYLQVQTRLRPAYTPDREEMQRLLSRGDREGIASLTSIERQGLEKYVNFQDGKRLAKTDIIVCTVGCAGDTRLASLKKKLESMGKRFSGLVIDEASLLTVPETLPLLTLVTPPSRVWLLGDPNQLPPTITSESANHAGLSISWMEFLQLTPYVRDHGEEVFSMLNIQYRMAPEIGRVVSRFLYDGQVQSSDEVMQRDYANMPEFQHLFAEFPELRGHNIGLYNYFGNHEQRDLGSNSLWNEYEVDVIERLLRNLFFCHIDMQNVVIIAMYSLQVKKLTERVKGMGANYQDVVVATVDSYQGKEADFILLSTVRSNRDRRIGFLREERRLNVAISRAKHYLMLVCDRATLTGAGIPNMNSLFRYIDEEGVEGVAV